MKPKDIAYIIVHCSDSNWGDLETLRAWHTDPKPKGNGWADIGYHLVIQSPYPTYRSWVKKAPVKASDGLVRTGRPANQAGAHALGYNSKSLGVCLVGRGNKADPGFDFTPAQRASLVKLVKVLMAAYSIPAANVLGHTETPLSGGKTCPNLDMDALRRDLE